MIVLMITQQVFYWENPLGITNFASFVQTKPGQWDCVVLTHEVIVIMSITDSVVLWSVMHREFPLQDTWNITETNRKMKLVYITTKYNRLLCMTGVTSTYTMYNFVVSLISLHLFALHKWCVCRNYKIHKNINMWFFCESHSDQKESNFWSKNISTCCNWPNAIFFVMIR